MGRRKAIQRAEQIKAESLHELEIVKEAGGNVQFLFAYQEYLNGLQSRDCDAVAQSGRRFLMRPVQMSAVAAMKEAAVVDAGLEGNSDENLLERVAPIARAAYVSAAGHHQEKALAHLPETTPEATSRREKAAADWDRLHKTDLQNLAHIALFGREPGTSPPMTLIDYVKGIGSLIGLGALAVAAFYVWTHRQ